MPNLVICEGMPSTECPFSFYFVSIAVAVAYNFHVEAKSLNTPPPLSSYGVFPGMTGTARTTLGTTSVTRAATRRLAAGTAWTAPPTRRPR